VPEDSQIQRLYLLNQDVLCGACWRPSVDVYRDREGWLVKFDLAGVAPDEIELTVSGRFVTVSGVRRDITVSEGRQAYSMEIAYSRFERSVELPVDVQSSEIHCEGVHGMFLVLVRPIARDR